MTTHAVSVSDAIDFLNSLFEIDGSAMLLLINSRVPCNERMANHKTVQVGKTDDGYEFGLMGVLNGLFGSNDQGCGYIAVSIDGETGKLQACLLPE